jgi:hypothetical protein
LAVVQDERVWEIRGGVGFGLVVVGGVGCVGVAGAPGAEGGDVEQIHGSLMVLLGGEMDWWRKGVCERRFLGDGCG